MAEGFNRQKFVFHGYVQIQEKKKNELCKQTQIDIKKKKETQICIETPYLNKKVLDDILKLNDQSLRLCVAINLTGNDQSIHMGTIKEWHKKKMPELNKKLCVYLIN